MPKPKKEIPQVTEVSVVDGKVTPSDPRIPNQGILVLYNEDLNFYRVQLMVKTGMDHPPICGILPPLGALVLMGGPGADDQDTHCQFALFKTNMLSPGQHRAKPRVRSGGGHTIVIGSGGNLTKKHKKRR
jgi:hypothetical protein